MVLLEQGSIPSGFAGLTKVLPVWEKAGNKVTAPHTGSAEYLEKNCKTGKVK